MTPCDCLPDIFRHVALLSLNERRAHGMADPSEVDAHYWGSADKREAFADFVICSFLPPWWMCRRHDEELAIIALDAVAVCTTPGALFCPINSAYSNHPADEIKQRRGVDAFDMCFQNPDSYQAGDAEIFVPVRVPLVAFRALVFCDDEARNHWLPLIRAALNEVPANTPGPDKIEVAVRSGLRFRFPGDFAPTRRIRG
jgi:hypothetical protein